MCRGREGTKTETIVKKKSMDDRREELPTKGRRKSVMKKF